MRQIIIEKQNWDIAGTFRIAHGSISQITVVNVRIKEKGLAGRGECRPYARYGETARSVIAEIEAIRAPLEKGMTVQELQGLLPAGAARNAVDCALWDLESKKHNKPVYELLGVPAPRPRVTAFTLSIDSPQAMATAAVQAKAYPLLKLKINSPDGLDACLAVMAARKDAKLIIDANEALDFDQLAHFRDSLAERPVVFIEQPLKADTIGQHRFNPDVLPLLCADEALHTRADLAALWQDGYRAINVKLDKTGGLSEAMALMHDAKAMGFQIMAGCMVGTSLAMAPMMMLESFASVIDLDGPLLLETDIQPGLQYQGCQICPPARDVWG